MKAVALALCVAAVALGVCAAAVFGLGDGATMVSPPEAVAEDFLRAVWMRRYPQAARYLDGDARVRLGPDALVAARARLEEATGGIRDVAGEESRISGEGAEGIAAVRGARATARVTLRMRREKGEWRVSEVGLAP